MSVIQDLGIFGRFCISGQPFNLHFVLWGFRTTVKMTKVQCFRYFRQLIVEIMLLVPDICRALKGVFGILGSQWEKLGSWDLTPFEIGILHCHILIAVTWDLTLFEIGISGSQDPPFQGPICLLGIR